MNRDNLYTKRQSTHTRSITPLVVASCEGKTEELYLTQLLREHNAPVKFGSRAPLGRELVDSVVAEIRNQRKDLTPRRQIIPIVICDLEVVSDEMIVRAKDMVAYGEKQGVRVFINTPHFERRILLHFAVCPETVSKTEANRRLILELQRARFPGYIKPGSAAFHLRLAQRRREAQNNCASSGHSSVDLPCLCHLIEMFDQLTKPPKNTTR